MPWLPPLPRSSESPAGAELEDLAFQSVVEMSIDSWTVLAGQRRKASLTCTQTWEDHLHIISASVTNG